MKTSISENLSEPKSESWDAAKARRVLEQQAASGQSLAAFARDRGIPAHILYAWRRRLAGTGADGEQAVDFLPVKIADAPTQGPAAGKVELAFPKGPVMRITGPVDTHQLTAILRALREAQC